MPKRLGDEPMKNKLPFDPVERINEGTYLQKCRPGPLTPREAIDTNDDGLGTPMTPRMRAAAARRQEDPHFGE